MKSFSWKKNFVAVLLLAAGGLLILGEFVTSSLTAMRSAVISVKHPESYNFEAWGQLLRKSVHSGLVDYKELKRSAQIQNAVRQLEAISPERFSSPEEKLAFWINVYNLLVIDNITRHYPIGSVQDLGQSVGLNKYVVGGKTRCIADIQREIIEPLALDTEPLSVFLLCSGALGGPKLPENVISAATLRQDADSACKTFVRTPGNTDWNEADRTWRISQYFKWTEPVTRGRYGSPFRLVNSKLEQSDRVMLEVPGHQYQYIPQFDWRLNDYDRSQER